MNRVLIRLKGYDRYALKYLRRLEIDVLNIDYNHDGNIYTIKEDDLEKLDISMVEIVSYRGIKRIIRLLNIYKHFLLSLMISVLLMFAISNVIVNVEVIHSSKDIRALIEDELYDRGIKPFIIKKSFRELQEIKESIKSEHPSEIEWLEIIDDGMKYTVRVEERIITHEEKDPEYCNVISEKDAVVISSVPKKGQSIVVPNEFVKKGSILISGKITYNEETKSHVCADGEVYGNTWYRVGVAIPLEHVIKEYTGKKKKNIGIEFGSTYNRIFKIHFDEYDVIKKKIFSIGKFTLYSETVQEYTSKTENYTEEEALEKAKKEGSEKLKVKLSQNASILNEKVLQSNNYDSIINVELFYSVKEVISTRVEEEIVIEDSPSKAESDTSE